MSNKFEIISPIDGAVFAERAYANNKEIEVCLSDAELSQTTWSRTTLEERADICTNLVNYFLDHKNEIAEEITCQMGRPILYAPLEISKGLEERATYMIQEAFNSLSDINFTNESGFERYIQREALGVVLVLAPWNYPYLTAINSVIPAIMAGNTVILKHAEQTALCAERFYKAFEYAGLPKGVFQYLHVTHEQVRNIILDRRIAYVAFTGSVEGGAAIKEAVGQRFISVGLELGGKDPAYVRRDADIKDTVDNLVDGAFFNSGQSCCGIERIYVHQDIFKEFTDQFVEITRGYLLDNPLNRQTTLGPMVRVNSAQKADRQIKDAVKKGASVLIGPDDFPQLEYPYFPPQILINVDHSMKVMTEESFAPIVGIMSVDNDEEAIQLMNDSRYGLTASVWTSDLKIARSIGQQIQTGTFYMNRCDYLDPALAWTGVKDSGLGCSLSSLGYHHLTRPKSFHMRKI